MTAKRKFKILITISVLFSLLIIVFGFFFRQFIYWQTSNILLEESKRFFLQVKEELNLDLLLTRKSVSQTVHLLSKTDIISAVSLEDRLSSLPIFVTALSEEKLLSALQVGYSNGDFFIVRPLRNTYMRRQFESPENGTIVVDNITAADDGNRYLQRLWFSETLLEIDRSDLQPTEYEPRVRPWYTAAQAANDDVSTAPYFFHFIQQTGITISLTTDNKSAVVAGDVSLYHLSEILKKYQETENSELVLLEKRANDFLVMAYRNSQKLITEKGGKRSRANISDLESDILNYAADQPDILSPFFTLNFDGTRWVGSSSTLEKMHLGDIRLVMLSPEDELLQDARKLQSQTLWYTLIMILLTIPPTLFLAKKISVPLQLLAKETNRIGRFEFSGVEISRSFIKEVDELGMSMQLMESTIGKFISLISSLASEQDFDKLLQQVTKETMIIGNAKGAFAYLVDASGRQLKPAILLSHDTQPLDITLLPTHVMDDETELVKIVKNNEKRSLSPLQNLMPEGGLAEKLELENATLLPLPLVNRQGEGIGLLCLLYEGKDDSITENESGRLAFIEKFSSFAAVTLESRKMLRMQKDLLESFIKILAGAIDSKSPYTGGHCQRVPILTKLLAQKACEEDTGPFASFSLTAEQWEALHISSWLHDCGKVTTPEYVVDKSTKLETIYDRIHEIRTRFEVIKRDAQICCWQAIADGGNRSELLEDLEKQWHLLDEEFAFVAECNIGGEFMNEKTVKKLSQIAERTWMRTLDNRLGVSWEEKKRKAQTQAKVLPTEERLLDDRQDHLIEREKSVSPEQLKEYGFILEEPKYHNNNGELYNLSISRGTLNDEERYQIKDHIVQTIIMLQQLPYPKHLSEVPEIAGGHHEKIDGTGYPRRLLGDEMSLAAKMMVIADIFEALTASDRPYKKTKKLSETIKIMGYMKKDNHIDPELFKLFLTSGAYMEYAQQYLLPEQIDKVDISIYLV